MCVEPTSLIVNQREQMVACRYCWQCRENRVNDLVGRCIAEQEYSLQTVAVTLTYRGDALGATLLNYEHVQLFLKKLRFKMGVVRYIVAGEYGTKNGRAHWHIVLFFKTEKLKEVFDPSEREPWDIIMAKYDNDDDARIEWQPWEHGFSYFQEPHYSGFHYLMKYALKDQKQTVSLNKFGMSKYPPLGYQYVDDYAQRYVDDGLAPQDYFYHYPHVFDRKGKRRQFMLSGKSRENFTTAYLEKWDTQKNKPRPHSPLLDEWDDKLQGEINDQERTFEQELRSRQQWPRYIDPTSNPDDHSNQEYDFVAIFGDFVGVPFIGLEGFDPQTRQEFITIYTERGQIWHAEGEKLKHAKRQGYLKIRFGSDQHLETCLKQINDWKDVHGLFGDESA